MIRPGTLGPQRPAGNDLRGTAPEIARLDPICQRRRNGRRTGVAPAVRCPGNRRLRVCNVRKRPPSSSVSKLQCDRGAAQIQISSMAVFQDRKANRQKSPLFHRDFCRACPGNLFRDTRGMHRSGNGSPGDSEKVTRRFDFEDESSRRSRRCRSGSYSSAARSSNNFRSPGANDENL